MRDALEQALDARGPIEAAQYVMLTHSRRLADAGIEPSLGSVGDSCDNARAETVIGLFKTEVIRRLAPWRLLEAVEWATLQCVDWYNQRRPLEPNGHLPPAEAEARYFDNSEDSEPAASDPIPHALAKPGTVQCRRKCDCGYLRFNRRRRRKC